MERTPSILECLRAWDGQGELDLPDEPPAADDTVRFAEGALDALGIGDDAPAEDLLAATVRAVESALRRDVSGSDPKLLETLGEVRAVDVADGLLEHVRTHLSSRREEIASLAREVIESAPTREALKIGIVLLGETGRPDDVPLLETIARHEEFTGFAVIAIGSLLPDPTDAVWRVARSVSGWGKIQAVGRLVASAAHRPDVRAWLVREGCDNDVMPEYLAFTCAVHGQLLDALGEEPVDDALLDGAVVIAAALLYGGPAEDIDDYADGAPMLRQLTRVLEPRCDSLGRLRFFFQLRAWLEWPQPEQDEGADWDDRATRGFTRAVRAELAWACDRVRARPEWRERILQSARAPEDPDRGQAWTMAEWLGVDLWADGIAELARGSLDGFLWYRLTQIADPPRFTSLLELAEQVLPLEEIAVGPAESLGLGPEFDPHGCLDDLLQAMRERSVRSDRLVAAALRSPVVSNRNGAVSVLEGTPQSDWGSRTRSALAQTLRDEPDAEVRARLRALAAPSRV